MIPMVNVGDTRAQRYVCGSWGIGGKWERDSRQLTQEVDTLLAAIGLGIRSFDTGPRYGLGEAERILGIALAQSAVSRDRFTITTKCSADHKNPRSIKAECQQSLLNLGLHYIDWYLLHSWPQQMSIEETMGTLEELVAEGVVKNIGVSNLSQASFDKAQACTKNAKLVCNQVHYNTRFREAEPLLQSCQERGYILSVWRPIREANLHYLDWLALQYGKTVEQIALNWLFAKPNVVVLCKTSSLDHLMLNLGAFGWEMAPIHHEWISKHFPKREAISDTTPLG